jgi:hypothetical protein
VQYKITPNDEATSAGRLSVCVLFCVSERILCRIFVELSVISLQQVFEKHEFVKIGPVTFVFTLHEGVNKFLPALFIFLAKFCKNVLNTSHNLRMDVNENFRSFLHFTLDSDEIWDRKYS